MADLTTMLSTFLSALYGGFGTGITYLPAGVIPGSVNTTPVSNTGTAETDLMSYVLPAGALSANGKGIRATAWGTTAANGNTKTIKYYFGSTGTTFVNSALNTGVWRVTFDVIRASATTQESNSFAIDNTGSNATPRRVAYSETLASAVTIKITGQSGTTSNDITQTGMIIEVLP